MSCDHKTCLVIIRHVLDRSSDRGFDLWDRWPRGPLVAQIAQIARIARAIGPLGSLEPLGLIDRSITSSLGSLARSIDRSPDRSNAGSLRLFDRSRTEHPNPYI